MPQPIGFQLRLGWSGWLALVLVLGLIFAVAAAVAVVLVAALVVLLPIALIAAFVYYLFPGLRYRPPGQKHEADIIEGNYRVVDPRPLERDRLPHDEP
jgi:hypothetical protein